MKSRDEIIYDMCLTWRHDYGLESDTSRDGFPGGTTRQEREYIWNKMSQIYDNVLAPVLEQKS